MDGPKKISNFSLFLFGTPFVVIVSFFLGEFFFGNSLMMLNGCIFTAMFTFGVYLMTTLLHAQHTFIGILSKNLMDMFLIFPFRFFQKGPLRLLDSKPFRAGVGAAFSLSFICTISLSAYHFWPRITSKLAWDRPLTKKEQAWEDYRIVRRMLKDYKRLYKKYPPGNRLVEEFKIASFRSERIKENLTRLKIEKAGNTYIILDPWGKAYLYIPYKKWGVMKAYRFFSPNIRFMK